MTIDDHGQAEAVTEGPTEVQLLRNKSLSWLSKFPPCLRHVMHSKQPATFEESTAVLHLQSRRTHSM